MAGGIVDGLLRVYLTFCAYINLVILKFKLPVRLISSAKKQRNKATAIGDAKEENPNIRIKVRIMQATNLPIMDNGTDASCDCYVKVKLGAKNFKTQPAYGKLNPQYHDEFTFESRKDATGHIEFELWDVDRDADDFIGKFSVSIAKVVKKIKMEENFDVYDSSGLLPVRNGVTRNPTKLRVQLSWDTEGAEAESEWLNMILTKAYSCFKDDVDHMVDAKLKAAFGGLKLPAISLSLDSFSIGTSAPFFSELRILPTRSNQDLQMRAHLRWVTSGETGIKVRVETKAKVGPSVTASVSNLEIDFPVWVQVHLQKGLTNPATKFQLAATGEPKIRFRVALGKFSTSTFPGVEEGIDFAIRKVLKSKLVLPNKISSFLIDEKLYQPIRYSPLEAAAIARLSIRVLEAEDVEQKQTFDKLNPYIILTCKGGTAGDLKRRTKAVDATKKNACVWNEHFDFLITDDSKEIVELQLMDKGVVTDDPCGCLRLPVEYLARAAKGGIGWSEKWHPLTQAKSGRIKLAIEYAELVPDDGPTEMDKPASKATPETPKEAEHGVVVLRIVEAQNVPTSMFGKPSAYVTIDYENKLGAQRQRTRTIQSTCNPHFDEDFSFQVENTKETEEEFVLKLKDHTGLNVAIVGEATLKLKEVLEYRSPRNYQLKLGNASLVVQAHFETAKVEHLAVGSDWLNGILRKAWYCFADDIEEKVKQAMPDILENVRHPKRQVGDHTERLPEPTALKIYDRLELESFELGQQPPLFVRLAGLNTVGPQDVQLLCPLHWVTSQDFSIKIRCKGTTGVPDLTIELGNLDLYFPAWIQLRLKGLGDGLGMNALSVAATEVPIVKCRISTMAGSVLPGAISENWIRMLVAKVLNDMLVIPKMIEICMDKDPSGVPLAANKLASGDFPKDVRQHNGLAGCICDVGVKEDQVNDGKRIATNIDPKCLVRPGEYMCAVDDRGVPIYSSVMEFKEMRFKTTPLQDRAVGRIMIRLFEADNLHDLDAWGTVDAYVVTQILGTGQKVTSCIVPNDTAPVWNEYIEFLVTDEEHEVLKFEVFDQDLVKNDFLGEVEIPIKELITKSGWNKAWMPLQKTQGGGEIHIGLRYASLEPSNHPPKPNAFFEETVDGVNDGTEETEVTRDIPPEKEQSEYTGKLMVTVSKGKNLIKLDTSWTADSGLDPYVKLDFGRQVKKTKTLKGLNPVFNETFGFDCSDAGKTLYVTLMDAETFQKDRLIGVRKIDMDDLMEMPNKKWVDGFRLYSQDNQECKDGDGNTSLLYMTIQYIEDGEDVPPEPPAVTADETHELTSDIRFREIAIPGTAGASVATASTPSDVPPAAAPEVATASTPSDVPPAASTAEAPVEKQAPEASPAPEAPEASEAPAKASLFVRVVKANDLQKMDWTGASDPYITMTVNGQNKKKTTIMDKCLDPVWEQDFLWADVTCDSNELLTLIIKDDDQGRMNEYMGQVEIPLKEIKGAKKMTMKVFPILDKKGKPVIGKSGKDATLTLDLEWILQ